MANWRAEVLISGGESYGDLCHCMVRVDGNSAEAALAGAELVSKLLTEGRRSYIRDLPEVESERDFDTKEVRHRGFARFSVANEKGGQYLMSREQQYPRVFAGFGHLDEEAPYFPETPSRTYGDINTYIHDSLTRHHSF